MGTRSKDGFGVCPGHRSWDGTAPSADRGQALLGHQSLQRAVEVMPTALLRAWGLNEVLTAGPRTAHSVVFHSLTFPSIDGHLDCPWEAQGGWSCVRGPPSLHPKVEWRLSTIIATYPSSSVGHKVPSSLSLSRQPHTHRPVVHVCLLQ